MALNFYYFSQVFVASMILIAASNGKAKAVIDSPFCAQTKGPERLACNTLVNGAPTWNAALSNVINAALREVTPVKPLIDNIGRTLPASLRQVSKDSIAQTCSESYQNVLDNFTGALDNIRTGDKTGAINSQLSAALSSLSDCTDGLGEFGVNAGEVTKFQGILERFASLSLAVAATKK